MMGMALMAATMLGLPMLGGVGVAKGGTRVHTKFCTPSFCLEVNTGSRHLPRARVQDYRQPKLRGQSCIVPQRISRQDRQIAKRLSRLSGERKRTILDLRRKGYGWYDLGWQLEIPSRLVKVSMSQRATKRYLAQRHHGRDDYGHANRGQKDRRGGRRGR
jgi:hypothetical protein